MQHLDPNRIREGYHEQAMTSGVIELLSCLLLLSAGLFIAFRGSLLIALSLLAIVLPLSYIWLKYLIYPRLGFARFIPSFSNTWKSVPLHILLYSAFYAIIIRFDGEAPVIGKPHNFKGLQENWDLLLIGVLVFIATLVLFSIYSKNTYRSYLPAFDLFSVIFGGSIGGQFVSRLPSPYFTWAVVSMVTVTVALQGLTGKKQLQYYIASGLFSLGGLCILCKWDLSIFFFGAGLGFLAVGISRLLSFCKENPVLTSGESEIPAE